MDFLTEIGIQRYRLRHQSRRQLQEQPDDQQVGLDTVPPSANLVPPSENQVLADVVSAPNPALSEVLDVQHRGAEQGSPAGKESSPASLSDRLGVTSRPPTDTADSWAQIIEDMQGGQRCAACAAATPILGEGDQTADWVFIIDAPSLNDSREQQLLSGRPGTLFKAILQALNLSLEAVYLTSVFKCPPAEDFRLTPGCGELLERQLNLIKPQKVVVFGEFAAQTLLRRNDALADLRGSVARLNHHSSAVMPTFSIAQMLERPLLKANVWRDLRLLMAHEAL